MSDESKETPKTSAADAVPSETKLLNTRQAADFMGLSPQRVNRLRRRREIPAKRAGWRDWSFKQSDLMAHVERAAGVAGTAPPVKSEPDPSKNIVLSDMAKLIAEMGPPPEDNPSLAAEAPIVRMANAILVNGLEAGASDIHIEPDRQNVRVRLRIDGVMHLLMTFPKHIQFRIMNRFKVMADVPIFQRQSAHLGSIPIKHGDNLYEIRVSVVPSLYGESIVMHLLNRNGCLIGLSKLGFETTAQATLEGLADYGSGLLLFAGPPGSGLSTTAFAVLNKINSVTKKSSPLSKSPTISWVGSSKRTSSSPVCPAVKAQPRSSGTIRTFSLWETSVMRKQRGAPSMRLFRVSSSWRRFRR